MTRTKRVLVLEACPSGRSGGAERSTRGLCENLSDNNWEVYLSYEHEGEYAVNPLVKIYKDVIQAPIPVLRFGTLLVFIYSLIKIAIFCRRRNIKIVVTHLIHAAPFLRLLGAVVNIKTIMFLRWRLTPERAGKIVTWGMEGIDRYVSISKYTLNYWIRNGVRKNDAVVIHQGIRLNEVNRLDNKDSKKFNVVFAGRIVRGKGLHILIEALARAKSKMSSIPHLVIVGDFRGSDKCNPEKYHIEIEKMIAHYNLDENISIAGYMDDVGDIFSRSDLVVVPSISPEALGRTILEAMSARSLVLAPSFGGSPEVIPKEFIDLLVDMNSSNDLSEKLIAVEKLDIEERKRIGDIMRAHIERNFNMDKQYNKMTREIERALSGY